MEECDDRNTESLDGGSAGCVTEFCGDSVVNNNCAKECEDGFRTNGNGAIQRAFQSFVGTG
eukprot:1817611-Rhodomonas_salina.1